MYLRETMDINPVSPEIAWLSEEVFELFDSKWDDAPENESLKKFLHVSHEEKDYYAVRYKVDWLVMNSYLFFFYGEENNEQYKSFLEFNKGRSIAFFNSIEDLNKFMTAFLNFYNQNLEKSKGRRSKNFSEEEFAKPESLKNIPEENQNFMLFFNKEIGTEFVLGYNNLIPDPDNEAYDPDHEEEDVLDLINQEAIGPALFKYLFQHYGFKRPYFPGDEGSKLLKENLEFLLRFHKPSHYHERPQVLLV